MRPSTLVSSVALAVASVSHAHIYQWFDCDGNGSLFLTELDAEPYVNLSGLYLACADLADANLVGADLIGANLIGADLSGAVLELTNLNSADLSGAGLVDANLIGANLYGANLPGAILSGANLYSASLWNADLSGANLSGARLVGANLTNADLTNANLSGADLTGADLTGANLSGANLSGAIGNVIVDISVLVVDQTGSCCVSSGCTTNIEINCTELGGTWTEGGSCDDCQPAADDCPADVDGDGTIGFSDVLVILNDWGVCP